MYKVMLAPGDIPAALLYRNYSRQLIEKSSNLPGGYYKIMEFSENQYFLRIFFNRKECD